MRITRILSVRSKSSGSTYPSFPDIQLFLESNKQARPNVYLISATCAVFLFIKWRFSTRNYHILQKHSGEYQREARVIILETQQSFSRIHHTWPEYAKLKEENIRHLQSQNIQQKRSIDRLSSALKFC